MLPRAAGGGSSCARARDPAVSRYSIDLAMTQKTHTYRLTAAGRSAWENEDTAVPEDYRRILWLMDFHGQEGVVGELLRRYPRNVLNEWLTEMEDLGLIEPAVEGQDEAGFSTREADRTLGLDQARMRRDGESASASLARTGAYISADRLTRRPAPRKSPSETVVLIVEDDPDQLALADLRVSMAGYKVRVAKASLGNRIAFAESIGAGRTVLETKPHSIAADEVRKLAAEILRRAS